MHKDNAQRQEGTRRAIGGPRFRRRRAAMRFSTPSPFVAQVIATYEPADLLPPARALPNPAVGAYGATVRIAERRMPAGYNHTVIA